MHAKFILRNEKFFDRFLEIVPGFVSYNIILLPYWGIFLFPNFIAYFMLFYNIYWFYQSLQIAVSGIISHMRIQASMNYDWLGDLKEFPDAKKVKHIVIIPTVKEPIHTLERTLNSLKNQTLSKNQLAIVLAMEAVVDKKERMERVRILKDKFGKDFPHLFFTHHPLAPGEAIGKASNERYSAIWIKNNIIGKLPGFDMEHCVATSCDADHVYHPNHFAALTFNFLDKPTRYKLFWQPAVLFYNNIWKVPALVRVPNILGSIWNLAILSRKDKLINTSNYSLSFKLLDEVGYWDPDKIPEDWGIFFKAYFKKKGGVEVEPLYLPVYADAPESTTFVKSIKNQYLQRRRWAWGVSDDPWIIKSYLTTSGIPFWEKTMRLIYVMQSHFLWPVHFFIITIGLQLPLLLNERFARTTLGYTVPKLSSLVLTIALMFLIIMLILDRLYRPMRPKEYPIWRDILQPVEFVLMPVVGFIFSALPGIDAHTRLMLGKYIEYKVTEKV